MVTYVNCCKDYVQQKSLQKVQTLYIVLLPFLVMLSKKKKPQKNFLSLFLTWPATAGGSCLGTFFYHSDNFVWHRSLSSCCKPSWKLLQSVSTLCFFAEYFFFFLWRSYYQVHCLLFIVDITGEPECKIDGCNSHRVAYWGLAEEKC